VTPRQDPEPSDASSSDRQVEAIVAEDVVEWAVDGEPVLDGVLSPIAATGTTLSPITSPAVAAAAAAATGFVAGAATLALARRRSARGVRRAAARRRGVAALPIVATRSFLIDVHMLHSDG
jgi:hypothetical protein